MFLYVFQLCGLQLSFWIAGCRGDLSLFARHALRKLLEILKLAEPGSFGGMTWWMEMAYVDAHILYIYIYVIYAIICNMQKKRTCICIYIILYYIHVHKPEIHEIPCHQCGRCNHCPYGLYRFRSFSVNFTSWEVAKWLSTCIGNAL